MASPIDQVMNAVPVAELPPPSSETLESGLPYATHKGRLIIGDWDIGVVVLNDGRRVLDGADIEKIFGNSGISEIDEIISKNKIKHL